ncbi:hypothetical protein RB2501_13919 [Robiginitalea biformata HTCC2501]|uniref:Transglutaminase-like domain-containing protein n=2 Tax=Robiginitalea TaxID=252306 RepID=A4CKN1_ROBBH|nr:hypothetical protein RB2501_13919 [Robiginitalea biformata HTCC2501]
MAKRKVAAGTGFDSLFETSACQPTFLGKSDTYFTVAQMKKWAYRFKDQTRKLALGHFSGMPLSQTCQAIYKFLYSHIQYELDGERQHLKSPACSWATRGEGTDCKSYSIFASTILQNLGIKHYFRKVRQPGLNPELWTHVYVVVPKDQDSMDLRAGHYVIDATLHNNTEVTYTEKNDTPMTKVSLPHYGLQAPGLAACSCTPKLKKEPVTQDTTYQAPTKTPSQLVEQPIVRLALAAGLGATEQQRFSAAVENFKKFLFELEAKGLPRAASEAAMKRLSESIRKGEGEPTIADLLSPRASGLGITGVEVGLISQLLPTGRTSSGRSNTGIVEGISNTSGALQQAGGLITSIVPTEIWDKTFGAVFANGFNFKCWGATWNPTKAEEVFTQEADKIRNWFSQALNTPLVGLEKAINDFWIKFYGVRSTERHWLGSSAKDCTKDGLKLLIGSLDGLASELRTAQKSAIEGAGHVVQSTLAVKRTYPPEEHTGRHSLTYEVPQYKVLINNAGSQVTPSTPVARNTNSSTYVDPLGNVYIDGQLTIPANNSSTNRNFTNDQPQKAGFGTGALLLVGAVALGAMYFKNNSNSKS